MRYEISVPFESGVYETLSSSATTQLPEHLSFPGIKITGGNNSYQAVLEVEAPNINSAKEIAVQRVEELLSLFALWNDGFRIIHKEVKAERLPDSSLIIVEEKEGATHDVIEFQEFASITKKRGNFKLESDALRHREEWPSWLKTALQLNYLGVISHDRIPKFIVQFAALEVLRDQQDSPQTIFSTLQDDKRDLLISTIKKIFREFKLEDAKIERLISRLQETQVKSNVDRITKALKEYGVDANEEDVCSIVRCRGAILHTGQISDEREFQRLANLLEQWLQSSLRNIIKEYYK